ncbi:MAG: hypothetical protein R3E42_14745 [Burkholderiaceae bacterium]
MLFIEVGGAADRHADAVRNHGQGAGDAIEPGHVFFVVQVARGLTGPEIAPENVWHDLDQIKIASGPLDQPLEWGLKGQPDAKLGQRLHHGALSISGNGR